jgi:hypothetical protein
MRRLLILPLLLVLLAGAYLAYRAWLPPPFPSIVFNWHGGRAGLDARGGGGPAVGLDDLVAAGITHVGVPQNNSGDFGDHNYIEDMRARDIGIVRTLDKSFNAGLGRDLGAIIISWKSPKDPGEFFAAYARNLQAPCDGIGWNLEHDIMRADKYPLSAADRLVATRWDMKVEDHQSPDYVLFRGRQFALIFQMYYQTARDKHPECRLAIGYSGYEGASYNHLPLEAAYGCDWSQQGRAQQWNGHTFAPITHAMCAWHTTVALGPATLDRQHPLPVIHTLQLSPSLAQEDNFRARLHFVAANHRPGDGLGTVEHGARPIWDEGDKMIQHLLGEAVHNEQ